MHMNPNFEKSVVVSVVAVAIMIAASTVTILNSNANTASIIDSIRMMFNNNKTAPATTTKTTQVNTTASTGTTGNGAPSGSHYNLNIIGVAKEKSADFSGGDGHRIFVALGGNKPADPVRTKILLSQSTDGTFAVLDANGTDGQASFKLPAPGTYSIWARPLGKPGGQSKVTTCATDPITLEDVCSTSNEIFVRSSGKSTFRDVTTTLTTIDLDPSLTDVITACSGATTVSLFDPCLQGYFWAYDNNGLKLLQLRFYPLASPL